MAINLGEINFGLGPDTRRLEAARRLVLQFGQDVNRASRSQAEGARAAEAALRRQERALVSAMNATTRLNDAVRRSGGSEALIDGLSASYRKFTREMTGGVRSALQFQRSQEEMSTAINRTTRALKDEEAAMRRAASQAKEVDRVATQAFNNQMRAQERAAAAAVRAQRDAEAAVLRTERAYFSAERAVAQFNRSVARYPQASALNGSAQSALGAFKTSYGAAPDMLGQQRSTQAFQKAMLGLNTELDKYKKSASEAAKSGLEQGLRRLADVSVLISGPMSGVATRLSLISSVADNVSLSMAAMVVGISAGAAAFAMMAKASIDVNKRVERVSQSLNSINGNMVITQVQMADLMAVADRTGTQFDSVAQAYARIQAASVGTHMEGEATRKMFEQMLFVSNKLGLSVQDTEGIFRAFEQIMSKGTVQAEELRGQLGDRLPGAFGIMADALGVTTKKLGEMMKKGEVSADSLVKFSETAAKKLGVDTTKPLENTVSAEGRLANALFRTTDALDKAIGFSTVYKMTLEGITGALDYLTANMDKAIGVIGGLAGAAAAGLALMYGPAVLAGFTALLTLVRGLTTQMLALNVAMLMNPIGGIVTLLVRLAVVLGGAVLGYELLSKAVGDTSGAHVGAIPGVKSYIKAQQEMKYTIRETTDEYIKQQQVFLQGLKNQVNQVRTLLSASQQKQQDVQVRLDANPNNRATPALTQQLDAASTATKDYNAQLFTMSLQIREGETDVAKLNDILAKQTKIEKAREDQLNSTATAAGKTSSAVTNAIDAANDSIKETQAALAIQNLPKYMQEWARVQADINKSVDDFRDKLVQAKVPIDVVNAKTAEYADLVRKLKEGGYYIQTHVSAWEALSGVLGRGMDTAMTSMVDGLLEGTSALETMRDTAKLVVADLIKTFLQLSAINPLKNALFGGDPSTGMPFQTLGGGLLGSIFSGLGGGAPTDPWAGLRVGANAGGTMGWGGGLSWVGENGPEIVDMRRGAKVLPQSAFAGMGGGNGSSGPLDVRVTVEDDKFQAYVTKRATAVAATASAAAVDDYSKRRVKGDIEGHLQHRRQRNN